MEHAILMKMVSNNAYVHRVCTMVHCVKIVRKKILEKFNQSPFFFYLLEDPVSWYQLPNASPKFVGPEMAFLNWDMN
jgi:hypothetical protein